MSFRVSELRRLRPPSLQRNDVWGQFCARIVVFESHGVPSKGRMIRAITERLAQRTRQPLRSLELNS